MKYSSIIDDLLSDFPYDNMPKREPLYVRQYGDLIGVIMNYGTHPCSYIIFPACRYAIYSSIVNSNDMKFHGGITYHSDELNLGDGRFIHGHILGWDYAHIVDYNVYTKTGTKYTKLNLVSHLADACHAIQGMEEEFDAKS
jgi:hypothetical protein